MYRKLSDMLAQPLLTAAVAAPEWVLSEIIVKHT